MNGLSEESLFIKLHHNQLTSSGIPEHYWQTVFEKIQQQIFDAGEKFQILKIDYENQRKSHEPIWTLQAISDLDEEDRNNIFLIDHAWTFRVNHAKSQLQQFESLYKRMCNILDFDENVSVDDIFDNIWKLCRTYCIQNVENIEDRLPVWYVMDEIGSAVVHSDTPNCRIVPFVHVDTQVAYSLLFPINKIDADDFIYADFAETICDTIQRRAALLPWVPHSFSNFSSKPEIPGSEYYLSGHIEEHLPVDTKFEKIDKKEFKVFTEYSLIQKYLTSPNFKVIENEEDADILWYTQHFRDFANLSKMSKYVNQFPFEYVITVKDLLSLTCRKFLGADDTKFDSSWFPITYNLKTEIGNFVSYYQHREQRNLDNYWIIKPYNLARSLDMHITNNLDCIMRLPLTGPKIAQKYITNPVLFNRLECGGSVKFDIRYVILLESVKPLKAYAYQEFFLRFANKPFEMKNFDDYEIHFTVMNYDENITMKHMPCLEFKSQWNKHYPLHNWEAVEKSILVMLRNVLECAVLDEPPCGIAHSPQSRAVYAADLMLEWDDDKKEMQPKLLEINWTPDCKRACEYYPDFYNHIFGKLFLDQHEEYFHEL